MKRTHYSAGFTLLELLVAIAIAAILMALVLPSLRDFFIRNNTAAVANEFSASILRARNAAASRNMCVSLCRTLDPNVATPECANLWGNWSSGWVLLLNPGCDAGITPAATDLIDVVNGIRQEFILQANDTGFADHLLFSPTGQIRGFAGTQRFDLSLGDAATDPRISNRTLCVSVLGQVSTIDFGGTCP